MKSARNITASFTLLLCLSSVPALAEKVKIDASQCAKIEERFVRCEFSNNTKSAVAKVHYLLSWKESGRTFPWAEDRGELDIPGGLEPGESALLKVPVATQSPETRDRMKGHDISLNMSAWVLSPASDIEGQLVDIFRRCWNPAALSPAALRISPTIKMKIQDSYPVLASIKPVPAPATGPAKDAFEAARRAVIRCGSSGIPDIPGLSEGKDCEITFSLK